MEVIFTLKEFIMLRYFLKLLMVLLALTCSCNGYKKMANKIQPDFMIVNLSKNKSLAFEQLKQTFEQNNQGYTIDYLDHKKTITSKKHTVLFIQTGGGTATIMGQKSSKFSAS